MGAQSTQIQFQPMQSIDSSTLTGTGYQPVGSQFTVPLRIFKIINNSTMLVTVSLDGVTDHDVVPAASFFLYDCGTNRGNPSPSLDLPNPQFYVNGTAGTGVIYAVGISAFTPQV